MAAPAIEHTKIDQTKLDALLARALGDLSAGYGGVMISIGHKLGLFKAMAGAGPISSRELAGRTGCAERYVREWLNAQAAGGYVDYHAVSDTGSLLTEWLPALDGVVQQLEGGITVADIGCGHGHSTLLMAQTFPRSRFHGFDTHAASIDEARHLAFEAGVADRVTFDVAGAVDYGTDFGLIAFFDSLHDLGDPVAAARHAAKALAPGGTVLLVEPFANDRVEDNLSAVARIYYTASTLVCCAHAISEAPLSCSARRRARRAWRRSSGRQDSRTLGALHGRRSISSSRSDDDHCQTAHCL